MCFVVAAGLFAPRLVLAFLFFFTNYTSRAFDGWFWPLLGFIFMPFTTLAILVSTIAYGAVGGLGCILVAIALFLDLSGVLGAIIES